MNAYQLLDLFNRSGVALQVDGDALHCKAPRGFMTEALRDALKQHKQELIGILSGRGRDGAIRPRAPAEAAAGLPLSFAQRQLWFLWQLEPQSPSYNNPGAITLTGVLDAAAFERSIAEVVRRHEALRTVFRTVDGEPRQRVLPAGDVVLPLQDLSALPEAARQRAAQAAVQADARAPFDLTEGPLLRTSLLKLGPREHVWLFNVHHIVADGWSMGILVREVAALYAAHVRGEPSPLAALPIQYGDYACWQAEWLRGDALRGQLAYWKQRLDSAPTLLPLPTDRPRPGVQGHRGAHHAVTVDRAVAERLDAIGLQAQGTLFTTLTAALAVLLWRYSGQADVCIGTPFANRNRAELEPLIGHFVNTLVVRSQVDPDHSFLQLLEQVRGHVLGAHAHQDVPFDQVVQAVNPERNTSHSPLFQVLLVLQNTPGGGAMALPGVELGWMEASSESAKFDLTVDVMRSGGQLKIDFEYNTDLFDRDTVARMAGHYARLLEQAAADPAQAIGALRLLGEDERRRQLADWNATDTPYPDLCIHELIEAQAQRDPAGIALVDETRTLGFGALNTQANRLARHLRTLGVGPDCLVGVCMERSIEMVVGLLAILKAGGGYVPLDPDYPAERLAFLLQDSAPLAVLTHTATHTAAQAAAAGAGAPAGGTPSVLIALDRDAAQWSDLPDGNLDVRAVGLRPDHLAYVMYTSGSTGQPKGVMVAHRGVANLLQWNEQIYGPGRGHVMLQKTPISFDASVREFFWPLMSGARLVLARPGGHKDPGYLIETIQQAQITIVQFVPALLRLFLEEETAARCTSLVTVQCGGGELPPALVRQFHERLPQARLHNLYGPTEITVDMTAWACSTSGDQSEQGARVPIGKPMPNTRAYVLDRAGEPVPIGVPGELHVGGAGVARGYLNRPALTEERFVPSPFVAGERLYKTGDLARWLPGGSIDFLGRNDFQVKVRGYRIELGEIEEHLARHPAVGDAVVLAEPDPSGDTRLVAYVTLQTDAGDAGEVGADALRAHLLATLPDYMAPAAYIALEALPLTPAGKVDRDALRAMPWAAQGLQQVNLTSPRDHVELKLYQIWKSLLVEPQIGIRDNFFNVGGTSISAIKLAHRIECEFGLTLPVREIISYPTIEALGGRIRAGARDDAGIDNLIRFRAGDGSCNVVCVHPAGGTAFCYLSLAKMLPESCGVYGLQSHGLNAGEAFLPSVEAMAQAYLERIAPLADGPLVITGLSYGGLVAHEMGRRLSLAGHRQASVVLLDTLGSDEPEHRVRIAPVELAEFRDKLVRFNGMYPGIDDGQIERYFQVYNHNRMTVRDYECPPQPGRVVLVQALGGRDRPFLREIRGFWRRHAQGSFLVKLVHGDHWEMLETAEVQRVGKTIRQELRRIVPVQAQAQAANPAEAMAR
ncbi:amino acid adenylation domain-containing protein [Ramlibacter sp.]|uniref:non-ribosomal peptide synthetase n=1 Tax=Ramlibacter sp. TaxID=1917967 RepID=UPI00181DB5EC|nr:amino acid adenylation domain-containing protein [Ramlibacter sp.]MBA2672238.1 amino acid adenylation domain-containing protein [Ramlibacter sp.]